MKIALLTLLPGLVLALDNGKAITPPMVRCNSLPVVGALHHECERRVLEIAPRATSITHRGAGAVLLASFRSI